MRYKGPCRLLPGLLIRTKIILSGCNYLPLAGVGRDEDNVREEF